MLMVLVSVPFSPFLSFCLLEPFSPVPVQIMMLTNSSHAKSLIRRLAPPLSIRPNHLFRRRLPLRPLLLLFLFQPQPKRQINQSRPQNLHDGHISLLLHPPPHLRLQKKLVLPLRHPLADPSLPSFIFILQPQRRQCLPRSPANHHLERLCRIALHLRPRPVADLGRSRVLRQRVRPRRV